MKIVKRILQGFGIIIGILVLYLSIVTFVPGFKVPEQPLKQGKLLTKEVDTKPSWVRKDVSFKVKGTTLSAWLYLPENLSASAPCIIMGHGFGGTKDMGLESYAIRYEPFLLNEGPEWVIGAYAPENTFLSKIRSGENRNALIALFVLSLSLIIGWLLIKRTWQPFERFFHDVITDQLTGLFNRRFLENVGSRMYIRLLRDQHEAISKIPYKSFT